MVKTIVMQTLYWQHKEDKLEAAQWVTATLLEEKTVKNEEDK